MTGLFWLDTNVILRYLLDDHPDHSKRALAIIEQAERGEITVRIPVHVICETVYILEGQDYTRMQICDSLTRFLAIPGIRTEQLPAVQIALTLYRDKNVDFSDALLYAQCSESGDTVLTFKKKHFRRLGPAWKEP
mgnify:CR=1 FL=1